MEKSFDIGASTEENFVCSLRGLGRLFIIFFIQLDDFLEN